MLLINAYVAKSKIPKSGLGLFAGQTIKKGRLIWEFNKNVDNLVSEQEYKTLPKMVKSHFKKHATLSTFLNGWINFGDISMFMNHSSKNDNVKALLKDGVLCEVAIRDILEGEELYINYRTIDRNDKKSKESYLNS